MTGISPAVVAASKLGLTFQTNDGPVQALSNVDLTIGKGEFVSFIGPSGCGKTTLLRVIADLEQPTSARSQSWHVARTRRAPTRLRLCLPGRRRCYPWRTIARNVGLPLEIMGLYKASGQSASTHARAGGPHGLRAQVSVAALRRYATARLIARALSLDGSAFDGRAVGALDEIVRDHLNEQFLELWGRRNNRPVLRHPLDSRGGVFVDARSW